MPEPQTTELFILQLTDANSDTRIAAVGELQKRRDLLALAPFIARLTVEPDEFVRYQIVDALGSWGDSSAVEPLIQVALTDAIEDVRWCAVHALGYLADQRAIEPLLQMLPAEDDPGMVSAIANTLGQIGDLRALPALWTLLSSPNISLRFAGAEGLVYFKDEESITLLLQAIIENKGNEDGELKMFACGALNNRGWSDEQIRDAVAQGAVEIRVI